MTASLHAIPPTVVSTTHIAKENQIFNTIPQRGGTTRGAQSLLNNRTNEPASIVSTSESNIPRTPDELRNYWLQNNGEAFRLAQVQCPSGQVRLYDAQSQTYYCGTVDDGRFNSDTYHRVDEERDNLLLEEGDTNDEEGCYDYNPNTGYYDLPVPCWE